MIDTQTLELEQLPDDISAEELRALVADRAEPLRARLAWKALARRYPEVAFSQARLIIQDCAAANDLRSTAAVELGRRVDAASEEVLLHALNNAGSSMLKHIFTSVGRIGSEKALEKLERLRIADYNGSALEALAFAKTLISYRLGYASHILSPDQMQPEHIPPPLSRAVLQFSELDTSTLERALPSIERQLPALPIALKGLRLVCGNSEHWIVLHRDVVGGTVEQKEQQSMIIGAILKFRICTGHYSIDEYLLVNSGDNGCLPLIGARPSGIIVHVGSVRLHERGAEFEFRSCNPPYSRPIDVGGSFQLTDGRLSFTRALVGTSSDLRAKAPAPAPTTFKPRRGSRLAQV
jgi:hypothetical protein